MLKKIRGARGCCPVCVREEGFTVQLFLKAGKPGFRTNFCSRCDSLVVCADKADHPEFYESMLE